MAKKKNKTKKVKAEKSKVGKKEKRKGSSEQTATAMDNVDNEEDETAEDIKVDEEEKKETKVVRNHFVEEDLMSFKQNFYLVNTGMNKQGNRYPLNETREAIKKVLDHDVETRKEEWTNPVQPCELGTIFLHKVLL